MQQKSKELGGFEGATDGLGQEVGGQVPPVTIPFQGVDGAVVAQVQRLDGGVAVVAHHAPLLAAVEEQPHTSDRAAIHRGPTIGRARQALLELRVAAVAEEQRGAGKRGEQRVVAAGEAQPGVGGGRILWGPGVAELAAERHRVKHHLEAARAGARPQTHTEVAHRHEGGDLEALPEATHGAVVALGGSAHIEEQCEIKDLRSPDLHRPGGDIHSEAERFEVAVGVEEVLYKISGEGLTGPAHAIGIEDGQADQLGHDDSRRQDR